MRALGVELQRALCGGERCIVFRSADHVAIARQQERPHAGERSPSLREFRRERYAAFEQDCGLILFYIAEHQPDLAGAQIKLMRRRIYKLRGAIGVGQRPPQRARDFSGDLVLKCERVGACAFVSLAPKRHAGRGVDQLRINAERAARATHRTVQQMRGAQRLRSGGFAVATKLKRGRAADDLDLGMLEQCRDDFIRDAVGEEFHLLFVAVIVERQHGEYRLGFTLARLFIDDGVNFEREHVERLIHFIELDRARGVQTLLQLATHSAPHIRRHHHRTGQRHLLQACGDIDAMAEQIARWRRQHIAHVHTNTDASAFKAVPEFVNRTQRTGGATEFEHEAVAGGVENAPTVNECSAFQCAAQPRHDGHGLRLIDFAQRRIADEVDR